MQRFFLSRACPMGHKCSGTHFTRRLKNDWTVTPTSTDSVFTITLLNPNFNYEAFTADASKLFRQNSRHIAPKELNYELPSNNIPEFAFVGR